ncbi:TetR/AcrR family transcriptional regulator [Halorarum salinum]|uniref:TetR/AcrR family transcriptional regulator n=1 Tax=Halorarum salinum TaxID=2743089 RepID=A0A7D5QJ60_9EURY|nr:TetR/AcrR family transcriptional regulator [Halobaculum salinum]QLG63504.1 TetR/AcrR family transcriptional regulator [Halobaculum salinum]
MTGASDGGSPSESGSAFAAEPAGDGGPTETEREITEATFRAPWEHGYADLPIADIADEFDESKSLLYYHYDSKDDLRTSFLDVALDHFLAEVEAASGGDPIATLHALVDGVLPADLPDERADAQHALAEPRMRAATDATFREEVSRSEERVYLHVRGLLEEAVESGVVSEVDVDRPAEFLRATLVGGMLSRTTTDRPGSTAHVRESPHAYLGDLRVDDGL